MPTDEIYSQKKSCSQMHFSTRIKWLYMPARGSHRNRAEWSKAIFNCNCHCENK